MLVKEILRNKGTEVISIGRDASVSDLSRLLASKKIGAVLVMKGDDILGIVSERDVVRQLAEMGGAALTKTVGDIMTTGVVVCAPGDTINSVMATMTERKIRHVPVVDGKRLSGLVSIGDVVKHRLEEIESEANMLRDYVTAR